VERLVAIRTADRHQPEPLASVEAVLEHLGTGTDRHPLGDRLGHVLDAEDQDRRQVQPHRDVWTGWDS